MSETPSFALWLMPEKEIAGRLQKLIQSFSKKYDSPAFPPHITLLSGLQADENAVTTKAKYLASSTAPLQLNIKGTGSQNNFYQSLYLQIDLNNSLKKLREHTCALFEKHPESFNPHISLIYGHFSASEKNQMRKAVNPEEYGYVNISGLCLMRTNGRPQQWKEICRLRLDGS